MSSASSYSQSHTHNFHSSNQLKVQDGSEDAAQIYFANAFEGGANFEVDM